MNDKIREKLETLPSLPGSYQMLDKDNKIIYVGKAKNLKNRVRSYFVGAHDNKTTALVSKIEDFNYIVTSNEKEAFLLEISLIKEYSPFYNIDLTDDKTYPYIEFTKEKNPKLIITRKLSKRNSRFFGPYTNVSSARSTMELLNKIYKMRKCSSVPKKPCIYYEMGECLAPCINNIKEEEYNEIYKKIKSLLYANDLSIINELKKEMKEKSDILDFEGAKKIRDLIQDIENTLIKQDVILKDKTDVDVFGISYDNEYLSLSIIYLRGGKIILSKNNVVPYFFDIEDTILQLIYSNYQGDQYPKNIFIDKEYINLLDSIKDKAILSSPIKGAKHRLLLMAKENSLIALKNKNKIQIDKKREVLIELSKLLNIEIPNRIESFDNSNLFGDSPVSSCVVYINGKKAPKEYRKYKIKDVVGPNDYATMREVVYRRYKRLLEEEKPLPDLILMDGGETQVNACLEILSYLNIDSIKVAGLKKDNTHTTNAIIYDSKEYELDRHSALYKFLSDIQEEVHRFAITFHRSLKAKESFESILDTIPGIGEITKIKLLKEFKTIKDIKEASFNDLKKCGLKDSVIETLKSKLSEEEELE